jgi:two-component system cell cycle sensor histidine kinase/response regulator CckA
MPMDEESDEGRHLAEGLQLAARMEAVGRLAGGIAHDFNNILTAVNGFADLALAELPPDDPLRSDIVEIRRAGDRGAILTGQLLAIGGRQVMALSEVELDAFIAELAEPLEEVAGEEVKVALALASRGTLALVDPHRLQEAILALAGHAREAMPAGGELTISTATVNSPVDTRSDPALPPGTWVRIVVADTGTGMDAETRAHAFEPYFTSKSRGKGAALRLAEAWAIVMQSGGHIGLASEPGAGTTFRLYLPIAEPAPTDSVPAERPLA